MGVREKIVFSCSECGYSSSKWLGKCPGCGNWNTFLEEKEIDIKNNSRGWGISDGKPVKPVSLNIASCTEMTRFKTGIDEFDRLLGGGMVPGSLILLGGCPGIGKSTILLQLAGTCKEKMLYISGEESHAQIKLRADRLKSKDNSRAAINFDNAFLVSTDNVIDIENAVAEVKPSVLVIDSIQTMTHPGNQGALGSVAQIRELATTFLRIAKKYNIVVFLIGHVTKEGVLAGPKILEHIVDVVLYFEDENGIYRIIRCFKNRFGRASEIAVFEMTGAGLIEVDNPEHIFYDETHAKTSGTVLTSVVEGTRPITIEIQALVTKSGYGMARRQVNGMDFNRLIFLIAIIEKRLGINLANYDIFVNVVGGLKIKEPSIDLAATVAILSSYFDNIIPRTNLFLGEVGLGGEIRDVTFLKERLSRAEKLGISDCIIAKNKRIKDELNSSLNIKKISHIKELFDYVKNMN